MKAKPPPKATLLIASRIRSHIRAADCVVSGDALAGLNELAHWLVEQAINRAKANGRKTIRPHDFIAAAPPAGSS